MKTWVITGGVATGKTSLSKIILNGCGDDISYFSCDDVSKSLWEIPHFIEQVTQLLGPQIISENGNLDRELIRKRVFSSTVLRLGIEKIFHPAILSALVAVRENAILEGKAKVFLAEVPLYYEIQQSIPADTVIVVAASRTMQLARLMERRNLDAITAENLLKAQLSLDVKVNKADLVVWNDGSQAMLEAQALMIMSDQWKL